MSRPRKRTVGKPLKQQPAGAPVFYGKKRTARVLTSDPWAFLRYVARRKLSKENAARVDAFVGQAFDFYEAAANPRTSSRPLLYYYSFLNLAKAAIIISTGLNLPLSIRHGISDPKANVKQRLRFPGQRVSLASRSAAHDQLFPEILNLFDALHLAGTSITILETLKQIPGIHRTCCTVLDSAPQFCPIKKLQFLSDGKKLWCLVRLDKRDSDVKESLKVLRRTMRFKAEFEQVEAEYEGELWFESRPQPGSKRGIDGAIGLISSRMRTVGVSSILTRKGYSYYFGGFAPKVLMPQLCAIYCAMFYLGSITRYKPHHFDTIVSQGYDWLVAEFLETQPTQFLYLLASYIAGTEVIRPHATVSHG